MNVDIAVIPSSDWKGIDPIHTQMAAIKGIENGHSILRSTRYGLSAGISSTGRIIGQMNDYDENNKILMVHLPDNGVKTLYSIIGNSFLIICVLLIFLCVFNKKKIVISKT